MKFYHDKFKRLRKAQRYTSIEFCNKLNIARSTLWEWESGKRTPSEAVIRRLSEVLMIDVSKISNLKEELKISKRDFSAPRDAVGMLFNASSRQRENQFANIIGEISKLKGELDQASVIIKALLTTMHTMFYIKDANLKYVIANSNFLLNVSMPEDFISKGHDDNKFFSQKEALLNSAQDRHVLYTKKAIITQEGYIPGTRKKKWGLISKIPIMDDNGNAIGIVGTFLDITERREYDEIRRILEIALNRSSYVVWLLRPFPRYKLLYVSESVKNLYGYPSERYLGTKNFWIENSVYPEDREKLEKQWINGNFSDLPEKRKFRIILPSGKIKYIESVLVNTKINDTVAYIEREHHEDEYNDKEQRIKLDIAEKMAQEGISNEIIEKVTGISHFQDY